MSLEFNKELKVTETNIPGLLIFDLPVFGDNRGWFKENWQREKMTKIGLPDFGPVQNNISFNAKKGVTRGIHAEPWDKYISVGAGEIFGAWVDLREDKSFGQVFTAKIDSTKAVFVPRGVGNSFQALRNNTVYTYLVNDHWSAELLPFYVAVNLNDTKLGIKWPIDLSQAEISEKDTKNPPLSEVKPMQPRKVLITGANGQLGLALQKVFPDAEFTDADSLDITDPEIESSRNWRQYSTIINAAAYTAVDNAETPDGKKAAWKINANGPANLAKIATKYNLTLVHVSSEYVFDGTKDNHDEEEPFSPLGVYAQTKVAGDIAVSTTPKHYILRTSWLVGDGNNFVRTMKSLAEKGIKPSVVNDQIGRLAFADELAESIKHLLSGDHPYGTYNMSGDGNPASWAEIAKTVYEFRGKSSDDVTPVSTEEYFKGKENISPRPLNSTLDLTKIKSTGFIIDNWRDSLKAYLGKE